MFEIIMMYLITKCTPSHLLQITCTVSNVAKSETYIPKAQTKIK